MQIALLSAELCVSQGSRYSRRTCLGSRPYAPGDYRLAGFGSFPAELRGHESVGIKVGMPVFGIDVDGKRLIVSGAAGYPVKQERASMARRSPSPSPSGPAGSSGPEELDVSQPDNAPRSL